MPTFTKFEEIEGWKRGRELNKELYEIIQNSKLGLDIDLKRHIKRTAESIMSNIAEGFERNGNAEFMQFLYFAKGSCGELRSQLYIAMDRGLIDKAQFENIYEKSEEVSGKIGGLIRHLKNSSYKGNKYIKKNKSSVNASLSCVPTRNTERETRNAKKGAPHGNTYA